MSDGPQFKWDCTRLACKKFIAAYTESGMKMLIEEHLAQHRREDMEQGMLSASVSLFRGPRNHNVLRVTPTDMGFLKTRGIKIDDQMEVDLVSEPKPSKDELALGQRLWARILHSAWELVPPKDKTK
jgi:hypothetical protein